MIANAHSSPGSRQRWTSGTLLTSLNCDRGRGAVLLACLALPWALRAGGSSWAAELRYERSGIAAGEWWRLASAHWVHLDAHHLLLDSAGLVLLWIAYARELRPVHWLVVLAAATFAIDAGLWWGDPAVSWYLGLSGLLHGAWAAGALAQLLRREWRGGLMLALLAIKLVLEQRAGASVVAQGMPVVTLAHALGALGGGMAVAALALRRKPL
jgi:rhomboid family GlyGly-CTERM serine protease